MRVVAFELNELPWSVVDLARRRHPRGGFARLLARGATFTTRTAPEDALHPWVAWSTMHRGVAGDRHGIRFLGQPVPVDAPPPLWEVAAAHGLGTGVFGSMFAGPTPTGEAPPGPADFRVPDPFDPDPRCHPPALDTFQALLVENVRACGRTLPTHGTLATATRAVPGLVGLGVTPRTLAAAALQVAAERRDPAAAAGRPTLAARLAFDVFQASLARHRPHYAAFFSTHLAWLLHRYWRAAWPEDHARATGASDDPPDDPRYARALLDGLDAADRQVGALLAGAGPDTVLILAAGLGQAPVAARRNLGALELARPGALLDAVAGRPSGAGIPRSFGAWTRGHAMAPDVPLHFATVADATRFASAAEGLTDLDGAPLLTLERAGPVVLVRVNQGDAALVHHEALLPDGCRAALPTLGIEHTPTETPGTAHHIPEGVLVLAGPGIAPDPRRREVCATRYAATVLSLLGAPVPPWMGEAIAVGGAAPCGAPRRGGAPSPSAMASGGRRP